MKNVCGNQSDSKTHQLLQTNLQNSRREERWVELSGTLAVGWHAGS